MLDKQARYNFLRHYDDALIFFNATTCALAVVDENFLRVLDDVKNDSYDETKYDAQLIADMKNSGYLVEDDVDELERLKFYRNLSKYDKTETILGQHEWATQRLLKRGTEDKELSL